MPDSYLKELYAKPCECWVCPTCRGFGYVDDPFDYSGRGDTECMDCDDPIDVCQRCYEIEEIEYDMELLDA